MNPSTGAGEGGSPLLWVVNRGLLFIMAIPGIGMIVASFLVSPKALTDDGYPLDTFLLAMGGFFLLTDLVILLVFLVINKRRIDLVRDGLNGTATVMSMDETGTTINDMPVMRLSLKVNDGYNPERIVSHKETIPLSRLIELRPGTQVAVKVDRNRPSRMMLLY